MINFHAYQLPLRGVFCSDFESPPGEGDLDRVSEFVSPLGDGDRDLIPYLDGEGLRDRNDLLHSRTSADCTPIGSDILCSLIIVFSKNISRIKMLQRSYCSS